MKQKLQAIQKETEMLNKTVTDRLKVQRKNLSQQRKIHPEFPDRSIQAFSHFIHSSNQYAIPIQNWKEGTPFYRNRDVKNTKENIHSASAARNIKKELSDDEFEYVMNERYDTATLEMPLHNGVFEVVPTHKEPLGYSHKCIWKEYW